MPMITDSVIPNDSEFRLSRSFMASDDGSIVMERKSETAMVKLIWIISTGASPGDDGT